ncbi:hypothetical protein P7C73_g2143, partial [Tremellales sp. Uapishka_1]
MTTGAVGGDIKKPREDVEMRETETSGSRPMRHQLTTGLPKDSDLPALTQDPDGEQTPLGENAADGVTENTLVKEDGKVAENMDMNEDEYAKYVNKMTLDTLEETSKQLEHTKAQLKAKEDQVESLKRELEAERQKMADKEEASSRSTTALKKENDRLLKEERALRSEQKHLRDRCDRLEKDMTAEVEHQRFASNLKERYRLRNRRCERALEEVVQLLEKWEQKYPAGTKTPSTLTSALDLTRQHRDSADSMLALDQHDKVSASEAVDAAVSVLKRDWGEGNEPVGWKDALRGLLGLQNALSIAGVETDKVAEGV